MDQVSVILDRLENGHPQAAAELFPLVYDELRRLAAAKLNDERPGQTLQPTALVHEVFLRMVVSDRQTHWNSTRHFFAVAADVMRQVLVDAARRKKRIKRGGKLHRVNFNLADCAQPVTGDDLLALNEALCELEKLDPVKSQLVVLRYFGGMSIEQACEILGISRTTAHRLWSYSRAWLFRRLAAGDPSSSEGDSESE